MDDFTRGLRTLSSARDTYNYIQQQKEQVMSEQVMGYVEKAKKLMDLADNQPFEGFATFQQPDDEGDEWCTQLHIESELWESMGRPDNITITIKPGDLLNGDVEMISGSLVGADDAD